MANFKNFSRSTKPKNLETRPESKRFSKIQWTLTQNILETQTWSQRPKSWVPVRAFRVLQIPFCFGWFQIWVTQKYPMMLWWYSSFFLWEQDPFDRKLPFTQNVNVFSDPSQSKIFPLVLLQSKIFSSFWRGPLDFSPPFDLFSFDGFITFPMKHCLFLCFQQFIWKLVYALNNHLFQFFLVF